MMIVITLHVEREHPACAVYICIVITVMLKCILRTRSGVLQYNGTTPYWLLARISMTYSNERCANGR